MKYMKQLVLIFLFIPGLNSECFAQNKKTEINDSNTPLHLMQPEYKIPYGVPSEEKIKADIDRVCSYLEQCTPAQVVNKNTNAVISDYNNLPAEAQLKRGTFRLTSYEWGVTYSAMQIVADATGDKRYLDYVHERFNFLSTVFPHFKEAYYQYGTTDGQFIKILKPQALDDAGAVCAAMIKAQLKDKDLNLKEMIDNYLNFILYKEHRLSDGTLARNRPHPNTLWLDDMYMGIPAIAWMGRYASDNQNNYYAEAIKQIKQFSDRMFVPEKGLFRHGWVESSSRHPSFFWARANGWAMLTLCDVLDALPQNYTGRDDIIRLLQTHIQNVTSYQSGDGFWHQLLDRNDSYYETSATAIFTYCIAHAINNGWIDPIAYGPVATLGWQAVSTKINTKGQVEGTCVGTGMAFDAAFYYYRPVNVHAAHGYGPVLMAGGEMIKLLKTYFPKMNDNAVQYYAEMQTTKAPIFAFASSKNPANMVPGTSRKGNKPVIFTIGDSTVKCGGGQGENNMWGWGSFFEQFFDTTRITVENHALGGRSSRTYYTEGLWDKVLPAVQKGDFMIVDFGHNDGGPFNTGRARASLPGTGEESETVVMERNGGKEEVYTFGHYLRLYIRQAKARGAIVIVTSHTPGNRWNDDGKVRRCDETYGKWSKEVAEQEGVYYIDLNEITALKYEAAGKEKTSNYFVDGVHNTKDGAIMNAESVIEGLQQTDCTLNQFVK
jgi:rhamnogalacturonyl hydrolase YesR/lysophospholipase L1-like esterase